MFGYSGLHYFHRIAVYLDAGKDLPKPGDKNASKDELLQKIYDDPLSGNATFDHLIHHSDAEGYYLPIDFKDIVVPDEEDEIAGGWVGSSVQLLRECEIIAKVLNIPSHLDSASDELWEAADTQGKGNTIWEQYGVETFTCVCLIEACRNSIKTGAAIVFC